MHARKKIIDAIVALLRVSPVAWQLVTPSRIESTRQIWPYIMVYSEDESSSVIAITVPTIYERSLSVAVAGVLRLPGTGDTQTIEDKMDALALEVETKLLASAVRGLVAVNSVSLTSTFPEVTLSDGEDIGQARIKMIYTVSYTTVDGAPSDFL